MSSRPQLTPHSVITNGDMSGNITSQVIIIQKLSMLSYSIAWTGTSPVGNITVEASNDYEQNVDGTVRNPGKWNPLPLSAPTGVTGNSDNGFIDIFATSAFAVRLRYNRGSGTGVMQVVASGKVT